MYPTSSRALQCLQPPRLRLFLTLQVQMTLTSTCSVPAIPTARTGLPLSCPSVLAGDIDVDLDRRSVLIYSWTCTNVPVQQLTAAELIDFGH